MKLSENLREAAQEYITALKEFLLCDLAIDIKEAERMGRRIHNKRKRLLTLLDEVDKLEQQQ
jgi:hypothetical protein